MDDGDLPTFPDNWNTAQIRRKLCDVDGIRIGPFGSALTLDQMVEEGFKVYGQENVISQDFKAGTRFLSPVKYAELKACSIASGDLLVTMMGTTGRCCVVPEEIDEGIMDSHLIRLRFQNQEVDPLFMALLIDKGHYVKEQIGAGGKGTIMSGLNSSIIKDVWVGLPEVTVQRRIIKYIDEQAAKIDRLMDMRRRQMALLKEQRAALIHQAVTRGLNPNAPMKDSGLPWLGEIPAHWKAVPLGYLATLLQTGPFGSQLHAHEYVEGGIPIINPSHMAEGLIQYDPKCTVDEATAKRLDRHFLQVGDVVFARRGELGRCALVSTEEVGWLCGTGSLLMRPNTQMLKPAYLVTLFQVKHVKESLTLQSVGSTMDNLNTGILSRTGLPLPPLYEQGEILSFIERQREKFDSLLSVYARQLALLAEYRAALIHECVTGQRPVSDRHAQAEENTHAL